MQPGIPAHTKRKDQKKLLSRVIREAGENGKLSVGNLKRGKYSRRTKERTVPKSDKCSGWIRSEQRSLNARIRRFLVALVVL